MCGIAGFISHDTAAPADVAAVRRMNEALAHRGPNASGLWADGPCALGHRRLSIIDLSPEANQPLLNEDGSIAIVVNGEIYNFVELREELVAKGHVFRSRSDSEVIVHLYEEHGDAMVARLHGMFAFALYDSRKRRLLLARDRAGKKPLFYRRLRSGLAFASEVHALLSAFPGERPEVDYSAIDEFLTLQYIPSPRSAYRDTWKLSPAHFATCAPGEAPRPVRYWEKPRGEVARGSASDLARELRERMALAVKRRLVSDVPLGAFLSGGIDSSTVVALMATQTTRPVKTFSIGFPNADDSEVRFARLVARRYGTDHHEMTVSPAMTDVIGETVRHHGEPFADSSAIATYYLAKMTREHVTVALSGDAGDENFAGYKRYGIARLGHVYDGFPPRLRRLFQRSMRSFGVLYPYYGAFAERFPKGEALRYVSLVGQFSEADKGDLYLEPMRRSMSGETVARFERVLRESGGSSPMARLADLDWQTYLTDDICVKVDIASMAHSLEVRCPFLDTDVVEFAARLPSHLLMRLRGKYLLRRAMKDLVPFRILHRPKRGFALPLERWLQNDLREMLRDVLLDKTARERGLFDPATVRSLVDGRRGRITSADRVWTLLVLELWFREFVDRRGAPGAGPTATVATV
jgi:asparagine synthase (glutamine-hydrolysing)